MQQRQLKQALTTERLGDLAPEGFVIPLLLCQSILCLFVFLFPLSERYLILVFQDRLHRQGLQLFQQGGYGYFKRFLDSFGPIGPRPITFHWNAIHAGIAAIDPAVLLIKGTVLSAVLFSAGGTIDPRAAMGTIEKSAQ